MSADEYTPTTEHDDTAAVRELLDKVLGPMPIFATRIGYRTDSTVYERALGEFLFRVSRDWGEFKAAHADRSGVSS